MSKKKRIVFYLDTTVAGFEKAKMIIEDYAYWFKRDPQTELCLFSSAGHPLPLKKQLIASGLINISGIVFLENTIPPDKLHRFYTKRLLLNEWVHYNKDDIFRLYKLFFPLTRESDFDNQPISLQYDIRYHKHRVDEYKSYSHQQTAHIASALEFYKPNRIIDAGCGAGAQYYYLQEKIRKLSIHYVGVDMSRFQIIKAIDLFSNAQTTFQLADVTNLDFENRAFDLGFSESTLMFCADPIKALKELNRVCKDGFFASLYTIKNNPEPLNPLKKGDLYYLDTGATWKYYNKITPNIYKIPDFHRVIKAAESFNNVSMVQNDTDQFFEPLGVFTANLFFFPKAWYHPNKLDHFSYHPLM